MKGGGFAPETVAVAPTSTVVVEVDTRAASIFTLFVENLDASQTFSGAIERWMVAGQTPAPQVSDEFTSISAGASVMADLDVRGTSYIRLVGTFSGAGGNVSVSGADRRQP